MGKKPSATALPAYTGKQPHVKPGCRAWLTWGSMLGEMDEYQISRKPQGASKATIFTAAVQGPSLRIGTQGQHNCANQTDEYILRGAAGAVGPQTALGRIPMRTSSRAALGSATPPAKNAEVYMPAHAIKGGR